MLYSPPFIKRYTLPSARKSAWHSFQLHLHSTNISISPVGEPLHISSLSPIPCETSLIPLNTSHVLLAGLTNFSSPETKRELIILLWDLQYSVLLASHTLPVPSSLSQCKEINLELVEASQSQTLLVISPSASPSLHAKSPNSKAKVSLSDSPSTTTSSILVIPYTVPSTSTIANAMGRGGSASKWLVSPPSSSTKTSAATPQEKQKQKLLQTMRTAMEQNRPQVSNKAFSDWAAHPQNQDVRAVSCPRVHYVDIRSVAVGIHSCICARTPAHNFAPFKYSYERPVFIRCYTSSIRKGKGSR